MCAFREVPQVPLDNTINIANVVCFEHPTLKMHVVPLLMVKG